MFLWDWLKNLWNALIKKFNEFIAEVFTQSTKLLIAQFSDFANKVIAELAVTDLTDASKRLEAFKRIKEYAISQGKQLSDSIINLLIELAVTRYKNLQTEIDPSGIVQ